MTLIEIVNNLENKNQIKLAIELIEIGLPIWVNYTEKTQIEYTDSVVGMYHKIDNGLIERSIKLLKKGNGRKISITNKIYEFKIKSLHNEIREVVVAREDNDFEIPPEVELILYSTSNLIEYAIGKVNNSLKGNLVYISINQSIDAITQSGILTFSEIDKIIIRAND